MKTFLISLLIVASFAAAQATPSLSWNPNPVAEVVTSYKVYEHVGSSYNLVATVLPPLTVYSLAGVTGPKFYAVSAVNVAGEGPRSADVTFPATPSVVTGLQVNP